MMTIQRQYNLPNCTLTLEGFSNTDLDPAQAARPSLDQLMQFECRFTNPEQVLTGGTDLLHSLVNATNQCAQEWMSGVRHVKAHRYSDETTVAIAQPPEAEGFLLKVSATLLLATPEEKEGDSKLEPSQSVTEAVELNLTTVQLFDLVEAIDQILADTQTLPNLSSKVRPLTHREAISGQPLTQRAAPLALGTTSLAVAAAALFFLPFPEVRKPTEAEPTSTDSSAPAEVQPSPGGAAEPEPGADASE